MDSTSRRWLRKHLIVAGLLSCPWTPSKQILKSGRLCSSIPWNEISRSSKTHMEWKTHQRLYQSQQGHHEIESVPGLCRWRDIDGHLSFCNDDRPDCRFLYMRYTLAWLCVDYDSRPGAGLCLSTIRSSSLSNELHQSCIKKILPEYPENSVQTSRQILHLSWKFTASWFRNIHWWSKPNKILTPLRRILWPEMRRVNIRCVHN